MRNTFIWVRLVFSGGTHEHSIDHKGSIKSRLFYQVNEYHLLKRDLTVLVRLRTYCFASASSTGSSSMKAISVACNTQSKNRTNFQLS
jgi:hypothetical protein